jgi:PAS domain-containing protein
LDISYHQVVEPSLAGIGSYVSDGVDQAVRLGLVTPIVVFNVLLVVAGLGIVPGLLEHGENVHWILQLLLFLDPDFVISSKQLFRILSNDISGETAEDAEDSLKFCERICATFPEPMIFTDSSLVVHSCNLAALSLLGKRPKDILKKPLLGVLAGSPSLRPLMQVMKQALQGFREALECDVEIAAKLGTKTLRVLVVPITSSG